MKNRLIETLTLNTTPCFFSFPCTCYHIVPIYWINDSNAFYLNQVFDTCIFHRSDSDCFYWQAHLCRIHNCMLYHKHYSDVLISAGRLKSPASPLLSQTVLRVQIKENIKGLRPWPLWGEFTGDRWIPRSKFQYRGKCFHLITSLWDLRTQTTSLAGPLLLT